MLLKTDIKDVNLDLAAAEAAKLEMSGVGVNKQVALLREMFGYNFTRTQIDRLRSREVYTRVVEEFKNSIVKRAVKELHMGVSALIPEVVETLKKHLAERNLQAVPMAVKIIGAELQSDDSKDKAPSSLTVILPGQTKKERDVT